MKKKEYERMGQHYKDILNRDKEIQLISIRDPRHETLAKYAITVDNRFIGFLVDFVNYDRVLITDTDTKQSYLSNVEGDDYFDNYSNVLNKVFGISIVSVVFFDLNPEPLELALNQADRTNKDLEIHLMGKKAFRLTFVDKEK